LQTFHDGNASIGEGLGIAYEGLVVGVYLRNVVRRLDRRLGREAVPFLAAKYYTTPFNGS